MTNIAYEAMLHEKNKRIRYLENLLCPNGNHSMTLIKREILDENKVVCTYQCKVCNKVEKS